MKRQTKERIKGAIAAVFGILVLCVVVYVGYDIIKSLPSTLTASYPIANATSLTPDKTKVVNVLAEIFVAIGIIGLIWFIIFCIHTLRQPVK